jgi:hypothetical protein
MNYWVIAHLLRHKPLVHHHESKIQRGNWSWSFLSTLNRLSRRDGNWKYTDGDELQAVDQQGRECRVVLDAGPAGKASVPWEPNQGLRRWSLQGLTVRRGARVNSLCTDMLFGDFSVNWGG